MVTKLKYMEEIMKSELKAKASKELEKEVENEDLKTAIPQKSEADELIKKHVIKEEKNEVSSDKRRNSGRNFDSRDDKDSRETDKDV